MTSCFSNAFESKHSNKLVGIFAQKCFELTEKTWSFAIDMIQNWSMFIFHLTEPAAETGPRATLLGPSKTCSESIRWKNFWSNITNAWTFGSPYVWRSVIFSEKYHRSWREEYFGKASSWVTFNTNSGCKSKIIMQILFLLVLIN